MNECDDAATTGWAGAIATDGGEVREVFKFGVRGEFGFLDGGYFDFV